MPEKTEKIQKSDQLERKSNNDLLYRKISLKFADGKPATLDEETRSVEAVGITEDPAQIYDWDYGLINEILLISGAELPKTRQVPLLDSHSRWSTSAVLGSYRGIKKEGDQLVGRVFFSSVDEAQPAWIKVREGHLTDFSGGYRVFKHEFIPAGETREIKGKTFKGPVKVSTRWRLKELSILPIGADERATVRAGNPPDDENTKQKSEVKKMPDETKDTTRGELKTVEIVKDASAEQIAAAQKADRERAAELIALGDKFDCRELAQKAIKEGLTIEQFKSEHLIKVLEERGAKPVETGPEIGLTEKETRQYSIVRAIRAVAEQNWAIAPFEKECSDAAIKQNNYSLRGSFVMPYDVMAGPIAGQRTTSPELINAVLAMALSKRVMTVGTAGEGGYLVATDLLAANFIDLLRNRMMTRALGATILDGLVGDVAIPRQTGGATAYWIAENADITAASTPAVDQVALAPKTVGCYTDISRKLIKQSSISVETFVRADLAMTEALALDLAGINGSGASNQPEGILNVTGIGDVAGGTNGLAPAWSHIVDLETEVAIDNADVGALAYLSNAKVRGKCKQVEKAATTGLFLWENDPQARAGWGMMNGYPAAVSNQVPSDLDKGTSTGVCSAIIFGNWRDLIYGLWGVLDILVDPYTGSIAGTVRIVALQDADVAVRHPESFAAMQDALTT